MFSKSVLNVNPSASTLLITEPPFNPTSLRVQMDEVVFEQLHFNAYRRTLAPTLALMGHKLTHNDFGIACSVVVDCGYSFTHVLPFVEGKVISAATKRINVGGKLLTNYLKETISYRAWNMMNETHVVNDMKEKCCMLSLRFLRDLNHTKKKKNRIRQHFVLPNGSTILQGYVKELATEDGHNKRAVSDEDQLMVMNNERIVIPELLFHPSDIGIPQAGIAEAIVQSVSLCDPSLQGPMYRNIMLCGGTCKFPNFEERV